MDGDYFTDSEEARGVVTVAYRNPGPRPRCRPPQLSVVWTGVRLTLIADTSTLILAVSIPINEASQLNSLSVGLTLRLKLHGWGPRAEADAAYRPR